MKAFIPIEAGDPLYPVDDKPLLIHIIEWCKQYGLKDFVVAGSIKYFEYLLRDGSCLDVNIKYVYEDEKYKGKGGLLLKAYRENLLDDQVIVWYGSTLAYINLNELLTVHTRMPEADLTAVIGDYELPADILKAGFDPKVYKKPMLSEITILAFALVGIFAVKTSVLDKVEEKLGTSFDMVDMIDYLMESYRIVKTYYYRGKWVNYRTMFQYMNLS